MWKVASAVLRGTYIRSNEDFASAAIAPRGGASTWNTTRGLLAARREKRFSPNMNVETNTTQNPQEESFAEMFEASLKERGGDGVLKEGEVVKGTVIQVTKDFAVVDVGYKSEGQIPLVE